MKLLHQNYTKGEEGTMKLVPEECEFRTDHEASCESLRNPLVLNEAEDMWHAFNLIREGDRVSISHRA